MPEGPPVVWFRCTYVEREATELTKVKSRSMHPCTRTFVTFSFASCICLAVFDSVIATAKTLVRANVPELNVVIPLPLKTSRSIKRNVENQCRASL